MRFVKNIAKGIITSLVGTATMVITLILVFTGKMTFVWNGVAGLSIGALLLIAPQSIDKRIGQFLKYLAKSMGFYNYDPNDNHNID